MTIEKELKELILQRYGSILEFTKKINIPYSTIDSIFKRGVLNSNIANIIKISEALNISVDGLAEGKIIFCDKKIDLSEIEKSKAIDLFSQLTPDKRTEVIDFMEFLLSKYNK